MDKLWKKNIKNYNIIIVNQIINFKIQFIES